MLFIVSSSIKTSVPVTVRINCPMCKAPDVAAQAYDMEEENKLFFLIPFRTDHTSWVVCPTCGEKSKSEIPAAELRRQAPGEANRFIRQGKPLPLLILLIVGLPVSMMPVIGLFVALLSFKFGAKYGGWARGLAITQLVLSILGIVFMVIGLLLPQPKYKKPTFAPHHPPASSSTAKP